MVKKRKVSSKPKKKVIEKDLKDIHIERALAENFIHLQKVLSDMAYKFDKLSDNISKLLNLFETAAKELVEKEFKDNENQKEILLINEKLENLIEQNRTIARGVALLHEKSEPYEPEMQPEPMMKKPAPIPRLPVTQINPMIQRQNMMNQRPSLPSSRPTEEYEKSITSNDENQNRRF